MGAVEMINVSKSFGRLKVLHDINLSIEQGAFLVLLGPSGCGKSTLLNIVAGLEELTSGDIKIGDDIATHMQPRDRDVAMVFQSYALYPSMTVSRNITFGLEMRGVPRRQREAAAQKAAAMLRIEHLLARKPAQLSGGQRQRVAMGRALVREPKVFLFDEPLSNLDAQLRTEMRTEIKQLHSRLGITTVYVTHDQIEAMTLATCIAVMNEGRVVQFGTPAEIYQRPASKFVANFVGSPAMTFIPARLKAEKGRLLVVGGGDGEADRFSFPAAARGKATSSFDGRDVVLGIRPEAISLGSGRSKSPAEADVVIDIVEPTGPDTLVTFALGGVQAMARLKPTDVSGSGPLRLAFDSEQFHFFDPQTELRIDVE